jgi:hypothetical protein
MEHDRQIHQPYETQLPKLLGAYELKTAIKAHFEVIFDTAMRSEQSSELGWPDLASLSDTLRSTNLDLMSNAINGSEAMKVAPVYETETRTTKALMKGSKTGTVPNASQTVEVNTHFASVSSKDSVATGWDKPKFECDFDILKIVTGIGDEISADPRGVYVARDNKNGEFTSFIIEDSPHHDGTIVTPSMRARRLEPLEQLELAAELHKAGQAYSAQPSVA